MKQYLTIKDMERICQEINKKHIPDDSRFMQAIDDQYDEYGDADLDLFVTTAFKRMLAVLDHEITIIETKVGIESSCQSGCAHCCYFPVILTRMEAKLIAEYIEHLPKEEHAKVLEHLGNYYANADLQVVDELDFQADPYYKEKYITKHIPCPLLDQTTNSCLAYEVRPVACRTHFNYCHPQVCADQPIPDEVFSYEFLYEYYMYALVNTIQEAVLEEGHASIKLPGDVYEADYLIKLLKKGLIR
ncbi:YkgJ family cysteine cluster protein [Anaerobacillus sp. CMMVII]|uniref:YkgJ family cysteine cluster protein n=1 Tax=Anaerobacillus sp. CMMVII TaxID=2755588 RepID=UPI0021B76EDE|nr:YkgJ family cysteine cluster protein [Anaerobacillus sp. CMMVII]MCT8136808.1 YkgJ family cysteine cluster protein [Anaerobacillus sp. CMMVII]